MLYGISGRQRVKNKDNTETKHNPEKANNAKHSKTKLAWFSRLLRHSARNEVGLFYNATETTRGPNKEAASSSSVSLS